MNPDNKEYHVKMSQDFVITYDKATDIDTVLCKEIVFETPNDLTENQKGFKEGVLATVTECSIYKQWKVLQEILSHEDILPGDKQRTLRRIILSMLEQCPELQEELNEQYDLNHIARAQSTGKN